MGKTTGFLEYEREVPKYKSVKERIQDYNEFTSKLSKEKLKNQSARCMDCGVPFCHSGCPLANNIPEFNDAVYREDWKGAYDILRATNNFPEFTGRLCPAPCEGSCVLGLNNDPTTIENIEREIIEKCFEEGYVVPNVPKFRTQKRVAVVGSGPSGLAAAAQLNSAGHYVVVFERADKIGGLLRYGIPDFKLQKEVIDRRIELLKEEGIAFKVNANAGDNITVDYLLTEFDAVLLSGGSTIPRDLPVKGRDLNGIHYAMDFLTMQNKRNAGYSLPPEGQILAGEKNVVIIGGGDTGSDCVGTSLRQGAKSVLQLEVLPKPPETREPNNPWPYWPNILRTSSSHLEGCERKWSVLTKEFIGDAAGNLKALRIVDIEWQKPKLGQRPDFVELRKTEREVPCELALLAVGFVHPQNTGLLEQLKVELDANGNVKTHNYRTSADKVFAAGDMRRGQSLVVWAISEGREAARAIDLYLMGETMLPSRDLSGLLV